MDESLLREQVNERTIEIDIAGLLPEVQDDRDGCLARLTADLQNRPGIHRAHLERSGSTVDICLHYDPSRLSVEDVQRLARRVGEIITRRYQHRSLALDGMDCSDCALVVEHSLTRLEGVLEARVDYTEQRLHIEFDARQISQWMIERRIRQLGYDLVPSELRAWYQENRELMFSLASGVVLLAGWFWTSFLGMAPSIGLSLYLVAYLLAGYDVVWHAWRDLRQGHLGTDLLMIAAALGAASLGDFAEGGLLLFLFCLGHALEERALERARKAIRQLADLTPRSALVKRDGMDVVTPVEMLVLDDVVIVRPGERIPVDGTVIAGQSAVDQSPVTGESISVDKTLGEQVYAGSVNGEGVLQVRVACLARDSTLARVMKMVEQAQEKKSPTQRLVERFTRIFVPVVLVIVFLLIAVPPFFDVSFSDSFRRAMTLLVATSPCALALGTPSAILAGVGQAARNGVLVKGGVHLENMGRLQVIAFDKTGTLTMGKPRVTDVIPQGMCTEEGVLALAAAVEVRSGHPLGQAVVCEAVARRVVISEANGVKALTGHGMRAEVGGQAVCVGSLKMFLRMESEIDSEVRKQVQNLEEQGKSVVLVSLDGDLIGLIAIADTVRPDADSALRALRQLGVRQTVMLSGDHRQAAAHIADQIGVDGYQAEMMPEDKLRAIGELLKEYGAVGMVGDGVNDAPALAHATVGIAMGAAGSDVALETADVALMASELGRLPFAIGLGRATWRVIVQNLVIALGVMVVLSGLALAGMTGIGPAIMLHEGSTLLVVANSLRLLRFGVDF